jgi:hypothetical protein
VRSADNYDLHYSCFSEDYCPATDEEPSWFAEGTYSFNGNTYNLTRSFYPWEIDPECGTEGGGGEGGGGGGGGGDSGGTTTTALFCTPTSYLDTSCLKPMKPRDFQVLDSAIALFRRDTATMTDPEMKQQCAQMYAWWDDLRDDPHPDLAILNAGLATENQYPNSVIFRGAKNQDAAGDNHVASAGHGWAHFDPSALDPAGSYIDNATRKQAWRQLALRAWHEAAHAKTDPILTHPNGTNSQRFYTDPYFKYTNDNSVSCAKNGI